MSLCHTICAGPTPRATCSTRAAHVQHTHQVRPHTGPTNAKLTLHYGLEVPLGAAMRVRQHADSAVLLGPQLASLASLGLALGTGRRAAHGPVGGCRVALRPGPGGRVHCLWSSRCATRRGRLCSAGCWHLTTPGSARACRELGLGPTSSCFPPASCERWDNSRKAWLAPTHPRA